MLRKLLIENYALIDRLDISFNAGFSTITGETGSGKSILLGALSLVLGKRADKTAMRDKESKCIVEAEWDLSAYDLEGFFTENDWDFDPLCIIRREITPSGKSRAFVNDSPVNLTALTQLSARLLDVHSQHQNARLHDAEFQLALLDSYGGSESLLLDYQVEYGTYRDLKIELESLEREQREAARELDYNQFLLGELEQARLSDIDINTLEGEKEERIHAERIGEGLGEITAILDEEDRGVLALVRRALRVSEELSTYSSRFEEIRDRMRSVFLELEDLQSEIPGLEEGVDSDPVRLIELEERLDGIYRLQAKHQVNDVESLRELEERLRQRVSGFVSNEARMEEIRRLLAASQSTLEKRSGELSAERRKTIPVLTGKIEKDLMRLGMPRARIEVRLEETSDFTPTGTDRIELLFSSNPGQEPRSLSKVASGGEISRIMLVLKAVLARRKKLPTLIFDEIDTGVSGEVSDQMGAIMKEMSRDLQVISITHIPQIAAKGVTHYKVYKELGDTSTETRIAVLEGGDRVNELAEMLSGKRKGESARKHAEELLRSEGDNP